MNYLSDYTQTLQTNLFTQLGAFFAFGQAQFEAKRKEGIQYASLSSGLIVPKENAEALVSGLSEITTKGIAQDLAENGRTAIIRRELNNHECHYIGSIEDCVNALESYEIGREEIQAVYSEMLRNDEVEF